MSRAQCHDPAPVAGPCDACGAVPGGAWRRFLAVPPFVVRLAFFHAGLAVLAGFFGVMWALDPRLASFTALEPRVVTAITLALAAVLLVQAVGLYGGRVWAWWLALVGAGLWLAEGALALVVTGASGAWPALVGGALAFQLTRPRVRAHFGRA